MTYDAVEFLEMQCHEKKYLPHFLISYNFACFSHLNVSDLQTNCNIRQRKSEQTHCIVLNDCLSFIEEVI